MDSKTLDYWQGEIRSSIIGVYRHTGSEPDQDEIDAFETICAIAKQAIETNELTSKLIQEE